MSKPGMPSREPAYFERLYYRNRDPWNFSNSTYEQEKYRATIAALGKRRFQSGCEIGCSIGVLTKMLAARCHTLLALDVVDTALVDAAHRCINERHVTFEKRQIPRDWPSKLKFDLIICSEILYFLSSEDISQLANKMNEGLMPGGDILLVNYTGPIDEPCNGNDAAKIMMAETSSFSKMSCNIKADRYRIDLLTKY